MYLQSGSLATTFSDMSEGSLAPIALTALTLRTYSLSGTMPSSALYFKSLIGREFTLIHFSVPASQSSMLYPMIGLPPFFSGGFQAIEMCFRLASVTCKSRGGEGAPARMGERKECYKTVWHSCSMKKVHSRLQLPECLSYHGTSHAC